MLSGSSGMLFGGIGMWIFWSLLIVVTAIAIKLLVTADHSQTTEKDGPLELLEKRYACGEIDDEEYRQRKRELKH